MRVPESRGTCRVKEIYDKRSGHVPKIDKLQEKQNEERNKKKEIEIAWPLILYVPREDRYP